MEFNLWIVMKKIIRFFILKFRKKIFMEQIRLVKLHFNIDMTFQTKKKKRILIRSFFSILLYNATSAWYFIFPSPYQLLLFHSICLENKIVFFFQLQI